jgi:hypothetical protein
MHTYAHIYIYIVLFGWLNTTHSCADGIPWPPVSKRDADILAFRRHSSSTLGVLMFFFTAAIQIKEYIKTYVILIYIYMYIYILISHGPPKKTSMPRHALFYQIVPVLQSPGQSATVSARSSWVALCDPDGWRGCCPMRSISGKSDLGIQFTVVAMYTVGDLICGF